ncbi:DEAD/DEAH box helicase [Pseudonocardia spirodelae]|uniref:Type ISP restriction/modification enzyme n=1 Tax=Pseudonocardia spirodelae TaxID=3133431 RepID=A0ABU8T943_9PSEU
MANTIYEVLAELRASALSESDKGAKFERLMQAFLTVDPVFSDQFSNVWMWAEWPGNNGKHDTGVDLVAQDRNSGELVAIQCKFFSPDTAVSKPMIDSFLAASGKHGFSQRIIVSTTDKWNTNAEDSIRDQAIPVRRIAMSDLEASRVDWTSFSLATPDNLPLLDKKVARPHQRVAIDEAKAGFKAVDRGKLIMACGTGKTFTSLRLSEEVVGAGGKVLFLVPSISLLSQTVREWVGEAELPVRPIAVCSDSRAAKMSSPNEDIAVTDLALPASTDVGKLRTQLDSAERDAEALTVVFATYQSIDVVARANSGRRPFDLIVADEAHRTTGTTLSGENESAFVRVHDNTYIASARRLYMTATPRIFNDSSKAKAGEANAIICSMDDESLYGPEFHRLSFGEAVSKDLLADYKVLVLAVDEEAVARTFQQQLSSEENELNLDDAAKIVGCWNGLAKRGLSEHSFGADAEPMKRAVAFAGNIRDSKRIESLFTDVTQYYAAAGDGGGSSGESDSAFLECSVQHVDGTFNALERNSRIDWLKQKSPHGVCRILTNARCLSEGVDVPALDAVMFLSPRRSVVDIVQSVGRVMRRAPGKQFGYIILPIGIPSGVPPEEALRDNSRYAAVWEVLQALRAHDERFDAMVNRIDLTKDRDRKINVIGVGGTPNSNGPVQGTLDLIFGDLDNWRDAIYAKIVSKVGTKRYWSEWAASIADLAVRQTTRINALLADRQGGVAVEFENFLEGLRNNLNEGITQADAIDMLAQHLITRPVFNALFEGYNFLDQNPVAQTMERMLVALDEHNVEDENRVLEKFYESVRLRVAGIDTAEGRQRIIVELYETFFATAFKRTVEKLGVVYTPIEIVDFIIASVDDLLRREFDQGLTDEAVHILDGFTGTGTFLVRLLQSGAIRPADIARKYATELHANEILLLAYYIAAVNIESAFQDIDDPNHAGSYKPFPGLILTDTFQSWEDDDQGDLEIFPENNERLERLKSLPITVILGNPPYSVGQESADDNNQNESYPSLDASIRESYAAQSEATLRRNLYDSYVRAFRWASLRIRERGVIAFVSNNAFLESNTFSGMRKVLTAEFTDIYILNLRGDQRTAGEVSRREGGKIFGGGSRAGVAITILVKNPAKQGPARLRYADIGAYLRREEKLERLTRVGTIESFDSVVEVTPNEHGDWIGQRREDFSQFMAMRGEGAIFHATSLGVSTNRDVWMVGSASAKVVRNVRRLTTAFNAALKAGLGWEKVAGSEISWSRGLKARFGRGRLLDTADASVVESVYRPFFKQWLATTPALLEAQGTSLPMFEVPGQRAICVLRPNDRTPFAVFMVDRPPNLALFMDPAQVFPLYAPTGEDADGVLDLEMDGPSSNVSASALKRFNVATGGSFDSIDLFYYVYGILHSSQYREVYGVDLTKSLPGVPVVRDPTPFISAGRDLAELHLNYESVAPYPLDGMNVEPTGDPLEFYAVTRMAFKKKRVEGRLTSDKSAIVYNSNITISGIPADAYRYTLGSRSAVEWLIDRYQVRPDKASSGIINDPNDWSREVDHPRYILELIARVVSVSVSTVRIVDSLPPLDIVQE